MAVTITQGSEMSTTSTRTLRVGVVGIGQRSYIADHVAAAGLDADGVDARIVAAADVTEAGRQRAAEAWPDATVVDGHRALIGTDGAPNAVDAAIVTTPDWTHAEIAIDLLRAGIAVYLEKPSPSRSRTPTPSSTPPPRPAPRSTSATTSGTRPWCA